MCTDHVNTTPTLSTTLDIMSILFCLFSPDFLAMFALIAILGNAHRPHEQCTNIANNSIYVSILFLFFFLTLWLYLHQLPYLEMRTDHVNTTPTLFITVYIMSILFSDFFLIFWLYLHYLPYLEMCTDHVNSTPILSTTAYTMPVLFFSFFSDFLTIFISITILGNAHRPCKQLSNITTPSLFFFLNFFLFYSSEMIKFTIFGNF